MECAFHTPRRIACSTAKYGQCTDRAHLGIPGGCLRSLGRKACLHHTECGPDRRFLPARHGPFGLPWSIAPCLRRHWSRRPCFDSGSPSGNRSFSGVRVWYRSGRSAPATLIPVAGSYTSPNAFTTINGPTASSVRRSSRKNFENRGKIAITADNADELDIQDSCSGSELLFKLDRTGK